MSNLFTGEYYTGRLAKLKSELAVLTKKKSVYTFLRLISFLAAVIMAILLWKENWEMAITAFVFLFAIFLFIVSKDLHNSDAINNAKLLISIQQNELKALDHQFTQFPDGSLLKPELHDYAHDLDIFGRASLFQFINRTKSEQGNQLLADWLLSPATAIEITERQKAVKELSARPEWRQQLQAFGTATAITLKTEQHIQHWLSEENRFINAFHWKLLRFLLPAISWAVLGFYIAGVMALGPFLSLMILMLAVSFSISKLIMPAYAKLNKITNELDTLSFSIGWIETTHFETAGLNQLKEKYGSGNVKASITIKRLKKILDRLDYRLNPIVFIPLSIFLCWDLQQVFALEKWKITNKTHIPDWFNGLAAFEVIGSFANLSFNHPEWSFPELSNEDAIFNATELGHPLIPPSNRITSSFNTEGKPAISLITGSNMAGKSTFLRSVGVNIVLAMTGAPVCARRLLLSPVKVMSSMRISDNLEENTSTFYAELKKLRDIIEAVNRNEKVFLLLDEILRGTNSADRHTGSNALIRQLVQHKAIGLVATHDLELAKMQEEFPAAIHNYHFDVQVEGEDLYFDYKLKEGICNSMNASILMKKIGIEL